MTARDDRPVTGHDDPVGRLAALDPAGGGHPVQTAPGERAAAWATDTAHKASKAVVERAAALSQSQDQPEAAMRVADPGAIVWDEVVAFWLVLWLAMPMGFWGQFAAFALFRFFDAAKPGPVGWADSLFKGFGWRGGWGILFDDFVAAFCTLLVLALWRFWFGA